MILLLTTTLNFALGTGTADSLTKVSYMDLKVTSGDTLWDIAQTYMSDTDDVRHAVYTLCQINNISADELHSGMTIQIPVAV
ncbi:MAG: LysM peptidoglycan-binding domain-containing protein [Firmicutes bacterium]|nr:LysM peptidoglycan-binding domain-containing protein [Bacillota bacterium]